MRSTIITGTVVREQLLLSCSECGAPTATPAHRDFIRDRLPDHLTASRANQVCTQTGSIAALAHDLAPAHGDTIIAGTCTP